MPSPPCQPRGWHPSPPLARIDHRGGGAPRGDRPILEEFSRLFGHRKELRDEERVYSVSVRIRGAWEAEIGDQLRRRAHLLGRRGVTPARAVSDVPLWRSCMPRAPSSTGSRPDGAGRRTAEASGSKQRTGPSPRRDDVREALLERQAFRVGKPGVDHPAPQRGPYHQPVHHQRPEAASARPGPPRTAARLEG